MAGDPIIRLLDFKVTNQVNPNKSNDLEFTIQMFGLDQDGRSYSISVVNFRPFFYVKVGDDWNIRTKDAFLKRIKKELTKKDLESKYRTWKRNHSTVYPKPELGESQTAYIRRASIDYTSKICYGITDCKIIRRHKLYGFDANREYKFVLLRFKNTIVMNKVKNLWYNIEADRDSLFGRRYILTTYPFHQTETELYEGKLPPLLRYFHILKD